MEIAILLYPGVTALDAIGPYEVLSRVPGVRIRFVGKQSGNIVTDTRMLKLVAEAPLSSLPRPDGLIIPGGSAGTFAASRDREIAKWVREVHAHSQWTASVCTGALILGAAGVLKGRKATTHWIATGRLARFGARHQPERVVEDGDVLTAQGVSAGIDLGLVLAARIAGQKTAEAIQLMLEYDPRPPFASGSLETARPPTKRLARRMLVQGFTQEVGQRAWARLVHAFSRPKVSKPPIGEAASSAT